MQYTLDTKAAMEGKLLGSKGYNLHTVIADLSEMENYVGALMLHFENSFQNNYWGKKKEN